MTEEEFQAAEAAERALACLMAAVESPVEYNALLRVAVRAGLMWECPIRGCRSKNYPTREVCSECRTPRGEASAA